jgi:hypothetical protein
MPYLAFAFLASLSLIYLFWHCRMSRARHHERRRLEAQEEAEEAAFAELAELGAPAAPSRGAPAMLIRSLPTFAFTSGRRGCGSQGAKGCASGDAEACCDQAVGKAARAQHTPQHGGKWGTETGGLAAPRASDSSSASSGAGRRSAPRPRPSSGDVESQLDAGSEAAEDCTICLCGFAEGELIKRLPCGHDYHAACIDMWLQKSATCPLWWVRRAAAPTLAHAGACPPRLSA